MAEENDLFKDLPDVQCTTSDVKLPINQVGVDNLEVPFTLQLKSGGFTHLTANVSMRTSLDKDTKGISMSRLLLTLKPYLDKPLNHCLIKDILIDLSQNIGAKNSFISFRFKLPLNKKSVQSNHSFPIFYDCLFEGSLTEHDSLRINDPSKHSIAIEREKVFKFFQGVVVQYSSYCPCSAALTQHLRDNNLDGYPHAQRSFAELYVEVLEQNRVWLEDLIKLIEDSVVTIPYPIIKREDECKIANIAYNNPQFVEDAIRKICDRLNKTSEIRDWGIKCQHQESIHTNNAIAICWRGIHGGIDGKFFIR